MADDPRQILSTSKDGKELSNAAAVLARSADQADQQALLGFLTDPAFLLRLDTAQDYEGNPKRLRLRRVLEELTRNQAPAAARTLTALAGDKPFIEEPARADLLITACAALRPPPASVVAFWNAHCNPEDGFCNLTVEALCENATPPAVTLLETKLQDSRFEVEDRINWLHSSVLTHRNTPSLIQMTDRLLDTKAPSELKIALIETMFDYQPAVWFAPATLLEPPPRTALTPEGRQALVKLAEKAKKLPGVPPALVAKIEATEAVLKNSGPAKP